MKALLVIVLMGTSLTASAIGHPHNMFSAHRKAQKVKTSTDSRASDALVKRSLTATVKVAGPSVVSYGWEILKKKVL